MDGWLERIRKQTTQVIGNSRGGKEKKRRIGEKMSAYIVQKKMQKIKTRSLSIIIFASAFFSRSLMRWSNGRQNIYICAS
jgi:hypothetical protein